MSRAECSSVRCLPGPGYTGKDMTRPLNAVRKQRNCHVKYISFDGQVAITGSGNMDTQR